MEKIYLDTNKSILEMLENGAKLTGTDEEKSEFRYGSKKVVVSTPYLNKLMPQNDYGERTMDSLTGINIGLAVNTAKGASSYASELSQIKEEKGKYGSLYKPRKPTPLRPGRRLGFD